MRGVDGRENDARGVRWEEEGRGNVEEEEEGQQRGRHEDKRVSDVLEPAEARKGGKEEGREDENDGGKGEGTEETESEGSKGRMCSPVSCPRSKPTKINANLLAT